MERKNYLILFFITLLMLICFSSSLILASVPYESYVYDINEEEVSAAIPYVPKGFISAEDIGVESLNDPMDLFVDENGNFYILDSGNNRVVITNENFELLNIIDKFQNNGEEDRFNNPEGIFVTTVGDIYVADTENQRIIHLDQKGNLLREIGPPEAEFDGIIPENYVYRPEKLVVDSADRLYVIVRNRYEGIVTFDSTGNFNGFMGAPEVQPGPGEIFWQWIATDAQRDRRARFMPTLFANINIDDDGFLFATVYSETRTDVIKRLNLAGEDIIRYEDAFMPPIGDSRGDREYHEDEDGESLASRFIDIKPRKNGMYTVLDNKEGRIFTYDENANLLYAFARNARQKGTFRNPVAIEEKNNILYILDKNLERIIVFEPTPYADYIHAALDFYNKGLFEESTEMWQRVLALNVNSDLAYRWIGESLLRNDLYAEAMEYFKLGYYRKGYSEAFRYYRQQLIEDNFAIFFIIALILLVFVFYLIRRKNDGEILLKGHSKVKASDIKVTGFKSFIKKTYLALKYSLYTMIHPFDGFWDLKHEGKGTVGAASVIVFLIIILNIITYQYAGFLFNHNEPSDLNIYMQFASVLVPFLIWSAVNWSITTLMNGKGKFKDIYMTTAYGLLPYLLIGIFLLFFTNVLTLDESAIFLVLQSLALIWSGFLIFFGCQTIHDYDLIKNIMASFLSIIGIGVVVFISLLFFSVLSQLNSFIYSVYTEIVFRFF
ncbi:MAG: YIP1 family protein [Halanaerobiaceae bacterium]